MFSRICKVLLGLRIPLGRVNGTLLEKLSRVTSSGGYVPQIDGLRLLAIGCVIAFHVYRYVPHELSSDSHSVFARSLHELANAFFAKGWFGVELFFVISGFILSLPFGSAYLKGTRMPSIGKYFIRRITRLEPPYILSLLIGLGLLVVLHNFTTARIIPSLGASLVYSHVLVFGKTSLINGVLWSLEVEAQFYILAPLLCRLFSIQSVRTRRLVIIGISIVVTSLSLLRTLPFLEGSPAWLITHALGRILIFSYIGYFLSGLLLCDLYLTNWGGRFDKYRIWDAVTFIAFVVLACLVENRPAGIYSAALKAVIYPAIILAAYLGVFRGRLWNSVFGWRWVAVLGGMCYTVYMYHQYIIHLLSPYASRVTNSLPVLFIGFFVIIYCVCSLLFVIGEKPFMYKDWTSRLQKAVNTRLKQ